MPSSFGDAPVLLLHTTGVKSGEERIAPMMYQADADDPNRVYATTINTTTGGGFFFVSNDGGSTWQVVIKAITVCGMETASTFLR